MAEACPDDLLALSVALTGYDRASLWATGCVPLYLAQLADVAGPDLLARLETAGREHAAAVGADPDAADRQLRQRVLVDPDLGPLARSLIQLWYLGQWTPMPPEWVQRNGSKLRDTARILSSRAYREGLVWHTIGAHPMGAKAPGFGSWALPPAGETP